MLAEAGVRYAREVRLIVDEVPGSDVFALTADWFQPHTWYAGSGGTVFRTLNDGDGWEPMGRFGDEEVQVIRVHRERPGLVAVATAPPAASGEGSSVHVSFDSGETWPFTRRYGFRVEDVAWLVGLDEPVLMMATGPSVGSTDGKGGGLYRLGVTSDNDLAQVVVDPTDQDLAFWAVTTVQEVRGEVTVVCAAQGRQVGGTRRWGVYLSNDAGRTGTFREIGLEKEDARVLAVQRDGPRTWLWAGTAAPGGDAPGRGCSGASCSDERIPWAAGTSTPMAGSPDRAGILRSRAASSPPRPSRWASCASTAASPTRCGSTPTVDSGLPPRDLEGRLLPVRAVAIDPGATRIMAGGPVGVRRTNDKGDPPTATPRKESEPKYESCSETEFSEEVTLPPTWLFVCGDNELTVTADATP